LREVLTAYKGKDPFDNVSQETLDRLREAPARSGD
jgi:ABC-2 type transport system ATP-binding protein